MLLSALCTLADSQYGISLDWKILCQQDSLAPWFPCTIRVAQQVSKAGEKTDLESPKKKQGNSLQDIFFCFCFNLTDGDKSQNLPTDNHCHLFLSERNYWGPDNFRKGIFQNNCESNSWSLVSETKWWPKLKLFPLFWLFSFVLCKAESSHGLDEWAVSLDMLQRLPMP